MGAAINASSEFEALEVGARVFDRCAVAVAKPVDPPLDKVERPIAPGLTGHLEVLFGIVLGNAVVDPARPYTPLPRKRVGSLTRYCPNDHFQTGPR